MDDQNKKKHKLVELFHKWKTNEYLALLAFLLVFSIFVVIIFANNSPERWENYTGADRVRDTLNMFNKF